MKRSCLALTGIAFLLPGVLLSRGWAQEGAGQAKPEWWRIRITGSLFRVENINTRVPSRPPYFGLTRLSFLPSSKLLAPRPRGLSPDNWLGGTGTWNTAADWSAGTPTSSSAVTIGNTSSGYVTVSQTGAASAASVAILGGNTLSIVAGNTLTVGGATSVSSGADLLVSTNDSGGSVMNSGGSVTNSGYLQIGNYYMTSPTTMNVTGTYTGTGGIVDVDAGNSAGANALLKMSGAAPGTLMGTYQVTAYAGSAAVEWGSGGITSIGDGVSNAGDVLLSGASAYMETGASNSNSALKSLTTIASNGELQLETGSSVTTT